METSKLVIARGARRALLAFLVWVSVGGISEASEPKPQLDTRRPQIRTFNKATQCNYDRVMVGPNGDEVVIWASDSRQTLGLRQMLPPSLVIIGQMHDPTESGDDVFFTYGGAGLRLFPVRWSSKGDWLFIRVREDRERVLAVSPDGEAKPGEFPLSTGWRHTDLSAIRHGDVAQLNTPGVLQRLSRIDGKEFVRGTATVGSSVNVLGVKRDNLRLFRIDPHKIVDLGINSGDLRQTTAFPDDRDYKGGVSFLGAHTRVRKKESLPYQMPIVDLETSRVAGNFSPTEIRLDQRPALVGAISQLNRTLRATPALVIDASLSGNTLVSLVAALDGQLKLIRVSHEGVSEKTICKKAVVDRSKLASNQSAQDFELKQRVSLNMFALNEQSRRRDGDATVLLRFNRRGDRGRQAVLYFHGGPRGSLADDFWSPPILGLLRDNRDIIAVEYSGSVGVGVGLSRRLASFGIQALASDMDDLAVWLKGQGYEHVFLVADSFGAVPGMILMTRHPSLLSHSFFTAPLVSLQQPSSWVVHGNGVNSVSLDTQLIRKALWRACLTDRYLKTSSTRTFADFRALSDLIRDPSSTTQPELFDEEVNPLPQKEQLVRAGWPVRKDRLPRAILAVSLRQGGLDFADANPARSSKLAQREYHHLYPVGILSGDRSDERVNRALNCALITWRTNRHISAKTPRDYLEQRTAAAHLGEDEVRARLESHVIPYESLMNNDYDAFLEKRAETMLAVMKRLADGHS